MMGSGSIANSLAFTPNLEKGLQAAKTVMNAINRIPQIGSTADAQRKTEVNFDF